MAKDQIETRYLDESFEPKRDKKLESMVKKCKQLKEERSKLKEQLDAQQEKVLDYWDGLPEEDQQGVLITLGDDDFLGVIKERRYLSLTKVKASNE